MLEGKQTDTALLLMTEGVPPPVFTADVNINLNRRVGGEPMLRIINSADSFVKGEGEMKVIDRARAWANEMRRDGSWGGECETKAIADLLGCQIVCYCKFGKKKGTTRWAVGTGPRLRIFFSADESHYSPLLPDEEEEEDVKGKEPH